MDFFGYPILLFATIPWVTVTSVVLPDSGKTYSETLSATQSYPGFSELSIRIEIQERQSIKQNKGMKVKLFIQNSDSNQIKIANPLDFVFFQVLDESGWPMELPKVASRLAINNKISPQTHWPFKVVSINNEVGDSLMALKTQDELTVLPKATFTYCIVIDSAIRSPGTDKSKGTPATKMNSLSPGTYQLTVKVGVVSLLPPKKTLKFSSKSISIVMY